MLPVELRDEVLVLLHGAQITRRLAGRDNLPVLDEEGSRSAIDVDPAAQTLAGEKWNEAVVLITDRHRATGERRRDNCHDQQQEGDPAERSHNTSAILWQ